MELVMEDLNTPVITLYRHFLYDWQLAKKEYSIRHLYSIESNKQLVQYTLFMARLPAKYVPHYFEHSSGKQGV